MVFHWVLPIHHPVLLAKVDPGGKSFKQNAKQYLNGVSASISVWKVPVVDGFLVGFGCGFAVFIGSSNIPRPLFVIA